MGWGEMGSCSRRDFNLEVSKLDLKDGDVVVIRSPKLTLEVVEQIRLQVSEAIPDNRTIILAPAFGISRVGADGIQVQVVELDDGEEALSVFVRGAAAGRLREESSLVRVVERGPRPMMGGACPQRPSAIGRGSDG